MAAAAAAAAGRSTMNTCFPRLQIARPRLITHSSTRISAGKEAVTTDKTPPALGPYSKAIKANGLLFVSGQLGIALGESTFVSDTDAGAQAEQALKNLGAVLEAGGSSFEKVVKTTIFLSDMGDFAAVNSVYGPFFPDPPPARSAVAVKTLPLNALVEIEAMALTD